jgi:hypothetical protein
MSQESRRAVRAHINALCRRIGSRMIGTPGDTAAAAYVQAHFETCGLEVISHTMPCEGWDLVSTKLRVDGTPFPAIGNMYSPAGKVHAPLVLCEPDVADSDFRLLSGKAVAVYGDFSPFPARLNGFALKAEHAGAACVIVIDTNHTTSATKLIREAALKRMPVASVSLEVGFKLAHREGRRVELQVESRRYPSETRDVIGILKAGDREICVEAHRDSAPDTPAADDNGSGTAVLLELARVLSRAKLKHTVRFVSATGEEFGNVGTPVYAKTFARELKKIDLMINADCVGGLLCPLKVYVQKGDTVLPLVRQALRPLSSMRLVTTENRTYGQISEYLGKSVNCVNVVNQWENARIHTPKDEPSNLSDAKMADTVEFLRDLVETYDRAPAAHAARAPRPRPGTGRAKKPKGR